MLRLSSIEVHILEHDWSIMASATQRALNILTSDCTALSAELDVSVHSIRLWRRGKREPGVKSAIKILKIVTERARALDQIALEIGGTIYEGETEGS